MTTLTLNTRRIARYLVGSIILATVGLYVLAYATTEYSQVARAIVWRDADTGDVKRFPARVIHNGPTVFRFSRPKAGNSIEQLLTAERFPRGTTRIPLDTLLAESGTTAFLIAHGDVLVFERYFNGSTREAIQTSFSVAKSFVSALVGIAIEEGAISSVNDAITHYLPELERRDPRFRKITIRHLLTMASGIRYQEGGTPWSDDTATYYAPDLRRLALSVRIDGPPGKAFHYNNYHPLLLGLILERTTGRSVSSFLETKLWRPLGMEAAGSWSLDSRRSGFEKMESGLNARAIDFAKFGLLYLNEGVWNGRQIVPRTWVEESTRVDTVSDPAPFYQYFWWVREQPDARRHMMARGNHGQIIYVDPGRQLILVRFGTRRGGIDWAEFLADLAGRIGARP